MNTNSSESAPSPEAPIKVPPAPELPPVPSLPVAATDTLKPKPQRMSRERYRLRRKEFRSLYFNWLKGHIVVCSVPVILILTGFIINLCSNVRDFGLFIISIFCYLTATLLMVISHIHIIKFSKQCGYYGDTKLRWHDIGISKIVADIAFICVGCFIAISVENTYVYGGMILLLLLSYVALLRYAPGSVGTNAYGPPPDDMPKDEN